MSLEQRIHQNLLDQIDALKAENAQLQAVIKAPVVLRLAKESELEQFRTSRLYTGIPALDVGFIHLSTPAQATSTAALYFKDATDLVLIAFDTASIAKAGLDLRWEAAVPLGEAATRGGDFPHLYGGSIPYSCLAEEPILLPLVDGLHQFPKQYSA
jgi:uncharacterized protein (DUF952 family)